MRLLINTSWSGEGEKLRLGIDVRGLARSSSAALYRTFMCELAVNVNGFNLAEDEMVEKQLYAPEIGLEP